DPRSSRRSEPPAACRGSTWTLRRRFLRTRMAGVSLTARHRCECPAVRFLVPYSPGIVPALRRAVRSAVRPPLRLTGASLLPARPGSGRRARLERGGGGQVHGVEPFPGTRASAQDRTRDAVRDTLQRKGLSPAR